MSESQSESNVVLPDVEQVHDAIRNLTNVLLAFLAECQHKVDALEAENHQMHDVVTAARAITDEKGGWFFRVAVPADDMEALSTAIQNYKGRG